MNSLVSSDQSPVLQLRGSGMRKPREPRKWSRDGSSVREIYGEDEAACIVARDCKQLRDAGVCLRAQAKATPTTTTCEGDDSCRSSSASSSSSGSCLKPQVCP